MPRARSDPGKTVPDAESTGMASVSFEVRRMARVLALKTVKDLPQNEQISFLTGSGYQPGEIAEMIHTTPGVVSQTLYMMRRGKTRRKHSKKKQP